MNNALVIAEDIVRRYRSKRGIDGISLTVEPGQCLGVLGANGSGKTTLTRSITGFDRIDHGRLLILGCGKHRRPTDVQRRCGIALDTSTHWNAVSGRQNLYFFARQYGLTEPHLSRRVNSLLEEAALVDQADEPVSDYTFGMRRKLSIIEALVADPDLLILDEASAGTDATFLDQLTQRIEQRCKKGQATWIADNDPAWLARTATHAILLVDGRVEARGAVPELMAAVGARRHVDIALEHPSAIKPPHIPGIEAFQCQNDRITAEVDDNPKSPAELLRWIASNGGRVRSMEIHTVTLRDALARRAERQEVQR